MTSQFAPSYGGARRGLHSSKHAKIMGILVVEDAVEMAERRDNAAPADVFVD